MNTSAARIVQISKYLSYHLRHRPDLLGLELAPGGWVEVEKLIAVAQIQGYSFDISELEDLVEQSDKRRFSFDSTGTLIRANQGHSVVVDLQLQSVFPPEILYHGTATRSLPKIIAEGLNKMRRHHVHLSREINTAWQVAQRKGKPVILEIAAGKMAAAEIKFYLSDNGVWLVDFVEPKYIKLQK
ncbi:MAG: RNA 2'-phosphotransferase [Cyanobacteria bacterium J06600_6]